jgi:hypothetical protein
LSPSLLRLIDALAVAEVADYMTTQAAPGNDSSPERSERPASSGDRQAA